MIWKRKQRPSREDRKKRVMVTPEGLELPIALASRASRFGALLIDLGIIFATYTVLAIVMNYLGINIAREDMKDAGPLMELLQVVFVVASFLLFNFYFMLFELGPRGATPGKRATGIRIAARDGGTLTAEAVIARNLLRDIELFLPLGLAFMWLFMSALGEDMGSASLFALIWLLIFALFPFFNRDCLRAGDLIAGTWVVNAPRKGLSKPMSLGEAAHGHSELTGVQYRFGAEELSVYGEHELQTLERVLRDGQQDALVKVAEAICGKIGWQNGTGDERAFLEAFYSQLRAKLESDMRFGKRKADKHS